MLTRKLGHVTVLLRERTAERRAASWTGIGPAWDYGNDTRTLCGFALHAGKHLLVVLWRTRYRWTRTHEGLFDLGRRRFRHSA